LDSSHSHVGLLLLLEWDLLTHGDALSCKLLLLAPKERGLKENLTSLLLLVVEDKLMLISLKKQMLTQSLTPLLRIKEDTLMNACPIYI